MAYSFYEFENVDSCQLALSKAIKEIIQKEGFNSLALSGGKSPLGFFHYLREEDLKWQDMHICLVDERIVGFDDKNSNTYFIRNEFLQKKASNAHFISLLEDVNLSDEENLKLANEKYKQPEIAVLGMGNDGHFASLFANSLGFDEALNTNKNIVFIEPKNAPFKRLSMSLKAIEACKRLFLLIQGKEKKEVFDKACVKFDANLPISFILHSKKVSCDVYYSK
ncbi:6-phosphogluconolactonase [Campylobacter sp. MIT 97-5078]|uniref:6-phosphogluconolactonase n=1 Tax=Campylobacter sp. MIT 97-5078 TaxID=1548153 RepID=UPI000513A870|nr:6-phosphogluconolactonase [Campylobacter sp. MIT 97-5078]KGI55555.1 hypothetical protein LR59_11500 [Campylobacter sp. MIT 97-5078]KGI57772.1 hypothetical protein LR59_03600 [Campylobacter sp. MIT 97-5078]TQR23061.1 6-phosphogluconolactonase [Campylobacter sp. MIT 97-5078]